MGNSANYQEDTLVVGIGSPHGNDQLGWFVAQQLMDRSLNGSQVRIAATPLELLDWIEGIRVLHLIDAVRVANPDGNVFRWTWPFTDIQLCGWSGTHDFGLPGVLALAEQLGFLPGQVVLWGIAAGNTHRDDRLPISQANRVEAAANQIQQDLLRDCSLKSNLPHCSQNR